MEQHFEFLRKHPIFESFTDEEIEQALVEFDYKIQSYKNDDIIVSSGKIHKYSAFVLEGAAQIQKYNSDGVREILGRVYSDSIGWLITAAPRTTHCDIEIVSHGESTILFLDFAKIKENDYKKIIIQQKLLILNSEKSVTEVLLFALKAQDRILRII